MILFTTLMIVWYVIYQFLNDFAVSAFNEKPSEKMTEKKIEEAKLAMGCLVIFIGYPYILAQFIYLLYFLKYDPFTYVTYAMLILMGAAFIKRVLVSIINRIRNKKFKVKRTVFGYIQLVLTVFFYAYALYALIVGF